MEDIYRQIIMHDIFVQTMNDSSLNCSFCQLWFPLVSIWNIKIFIKVSISTQLTEIQVLITSKTFAIHFFTNFVFHSEIDFLQMSIFQYFNRHCILLVMVEGFFLQWNHRYLCKYKHKCSELTVRHKTR